MKKTILWIIALLLCLLMTGGIVQAGEDAALEQTAVMLPGDTEDFDATAVLEQEQSREIELLDKLAQLFDIVYTEEEVDQAILARMQANGLDEQYSLEEYKDLRGAGWVYLVEKLDVEYQKVNEELDQILSYANDDSEYTEPEDMTFHALSSFTAQTLDGGVFTQEDLAEKDITIMYVWTTFCGFCIDEMPELKEFAQSLPENVQLITYCGDGSYSQDLAKEILDKNGIDLVTIISGDGDFRKLDYELMYTPTAVFFNSKGEVVEEFLIGAGDLAERYGSTLEHALGQVE